MARTRWATSTMCATRSRRCARVSPRGDSRSRRRRDDRHAPPRVPVAATFPAVIDVDAFRAEAEAWLAANRKDAPRDYGAILPPDLRQEGTAWQRRVFDAGFAGIHWPVEHGGRGLTPAHTGAWIEQCALA